MGDHSSWFDFLYQLDAVQKLHHIAEIQLGRTEGAKYHFEWMAFTNSHFTLSHVFGFLFVALFLFFGAMHYRRAVTGGDKGLVPPAKFGLRNLFEMFADGFFGLACNVMGKKDAKRFFPLIGALAFCIFFCNFLALIPGMLPPTDTLKTNVAFAIVVFLATHFYGLREHGIGYLKHFLGPYLPIAPVMLPIEIISHLARPMSLSLRLMGNMAADHKVLATFFGLVPLFVPVPFLIMGFLVVTVQTLVFCLLSMVYISMAVAHDH